MTFAELLHTIVPDFAPVVTDAPTLDDDADLPGVADLIPGMVVNVIDDSLYAPRVEQIIVLCPVDEYGYIQAGTDYSELPKYISTHALHIVAVLQ